MNKKQPTIEQLLNFNLEKELDLSSLSKEEQENFNQKMFELLIERVIKRTTENLLEEDQNKILKMIEEEKNLDEIFNFIGSKNKNFLEEYGEEFLDFKEEIYDLLKI